MQLFGSKKSGKHAVSNKDSEKERAYTEAAEEESLGHASDETQRLDFSNGSEDSAVKAEETDFDEIFGDKKAGDKAPTKADEIISERKKKGKKKKAWKIILIVLLVCAVLAVGAYIYVEYFTAPPDIDSGGIATVTPDAVDGRKPGVYTFLVAGVDQISNNTDTIMIGSFDVVKHKLNVVSIPRDTLINIQHEYKKANSAYHYANYYSAIDGSSYYGKDPIDCMRQELVKSMLGFNVDNYVLVNLNACTELVNTIGGVQFDVPVDMNYDSNKQNLHIHISKGVQQLSGEQFVQVMRFRSGYADADLGRIKTQQKLLKALADQLLTVKNIPNLPEAIKVVTDNMQTNMSTDNMIYLAKEFLKLEKDDIQFFTMPKYDTGSVFGESYVFADIGEWIKLVNEHFNPWTTDITAQHIDMVTYKDGHFYYTTERLRGGIESFMFYSADKAMAAAGELVFEDSTPPATENTEGAE